ncbi:MAG: hypothetical protein IPK00_20800 [Deltaproteobacteria bacterium]|nr:hypothetical protein [Deltaproteobacteria bacterium]
MGVPRRSGVGRGVLAIAAGALIGLGLIFFTHREDLRRTDRRIEIAVNGVPIRLARDLQLPTHGFTLQIVFTPPPDPARRPALVVELREERTGKTLEIQDDLIYRDGYATFAVPEALGVREGLIAVRARATFADGTSAEDWRRLRIRGFFGGPPIGARQITHFDFGVDRDGDGRPDFERDLEAMGLGEAGRPELAHDLASRVAERALARVLRAYDASDDPNRTGLPRDPVAVRFQLGASERMADRPYTTRICVGGRDPAQPGSVGHVRFDARNARRSSDECMGKQTAGLFPAELAIYREAALYREVLGPFDPAIGGVPFGRDDAERPAGDAAAPGPRAEELARAIEVVGDVLGTLMAHEAAHTLGLVPPGRPAFGLFGGTVGEEYAHAVGPDGETSPAPSLMDRGRSLSFEALAGAGEAGELRFRPLEYAYLRDRVVLQSDARNPYPDPPEAPLE